MITTCLLSVLVLQSPADAFVPPPKSVATTAEIDKWVSAHKGYSGDRIGKIGFTWKGNNVYVSWVSPFSGRNALKSWTYQRSRLNTNWYLVDTRLHDPPFATVVLDGKRGQLNFMGKKGVVEGVLKLRLRT